MDIENEFSYYSTGVHPVYGSLEYKKADFLFPDRVTEPHPPEPIPSLPLSPWEKLASAGLIVPFIVFPVAGIAAGHAGGGVTSPDWHPGLGPDLGHAGVSLGANLQSELNLRDQSPPLAISTEGLRIGREYKTWRDIAQDLFALPESCTARPAPPAPAFTETVSATPTTVATEVKPTLAPTPTATPGILAVPTREAVGGAPLPNTSERQALYAKANQELVKNLPGLKSAVITAQLEGEYYQALGEAVINEGGSDKTIEFLVKPDATILRLSDRVKGLTWSFAKGQPTWQDSVGNVFGMVSEPNDVSGWQVSFQDYGIVVHELGLPLFNTSFPKDQPLLVRVLKNPQGQITDIYVQVSPASWVGVDPRYFNRLQLTPQAIADATISYPTPTPEPTPTAVPKEIPAAVAIDTMIGPANLHGQQNMDYANAQFVRSYFPSNTGDMTVSVLTFTQGRTSYDKFVAGKATMDGSYINSRPVKFFNVIEAYVKGGESFIEFDMTNTNKVKVHVIMRLGGNHIITNVGKGWGMWSYQTGGIYQPGNIQSGDKVGYFNLDLINKAVNKVTTVSDKPVYIDGSGSTEVEIFSGQ